MNIEFEATFLDIDKEEIRLFLEKLGAKLLKKERLMRRFVFHPPKQLSRGWMRVRDEGDKITMSLKQITGEKIEDQKEAELVIHNFEEGVKFLEAIGAQKKAYQETKRESWEYKGTKIEIDTWPGLEPFVEVEGESEESVRLVAEELGFNFLDAIFGAVDTVYLKKLGIPTDVINNKTPEITFKNPPKQYEG